MVVLSTPYHPEDVKAELRKRHGTIAAFAAAHNIKPQAVADWLRKRSGRGPVADAVAAELGVDKVEIEPGKSIDMDSSPEPEVLHRLNAGAR